MFGNTPDPKSVKGYKIELEILCDWMLCEPTCSGEPARYVHDNMSRVACLSADKKVLRLHASCNQFCNVDESGKDDSNGSPSFKKRVRVSACSAWQKR